MPNLEALWWFDELKFAGKTIDTSTGVPRSEWEYRLLIRMPDFVTEADLPDAVKTTSNKRESTLAKNIERYTMSEGNCVQMLHVGPFANEHVTLKIIGSFVEANNLALNGKHHEIYLSDFRKTAQENLKTVLRETVK